MNQPRCNQEAIALEIEADKLQARAWKFTEEGELLLGIAYYHTSLDKREQAGLLRLADLKA